MTLTLVAVAWPLASVTTCALWAYAHRTRPARQADMGLAA